MFFRKKNIIFTSIFILSSLFANSWYEEKLPIEFWKQSFFIAKQIYELKTDHQHLTIFDNPLFGRVLALDGIIQTTEADEYIYHEMIVHVPLLAHSNPKNILIIGGGDGGALREVLRHPTVKKVTLVEIDPLVVEISKKYLPTLSQGAFDDPRFKLIIQDGLKFVKNSDEKFDVIICDSTDPIGPSEVLFTAEFYKNCKKVLSKGGILVTQNGDTFTQGEEITNSYKNLSPHFQEVRFYLAAVPTYTGGCIAFGWATDNLSHFLISKRQLETRLKKVKGEMRYYTPSVHRAAFVLPKYVEKLIAG